MITLNASGGSVTFEFSGNSTYLNDGQITVPVNSLALIIDESDMATFRKAASNDIFVSANIAEFGMTKAELEAWYKANMVGSTGGGGGTDTGTVQTMIDESISGKADSSAVTEEISAAVSGKANSSDVYTTGQTSGATQISSALAEKLDATAYTPTVVDAALSQSSTNPVQNKVLYDELRVENETLLTFSDNIATNYPSGCTTIKVEVSGTGDMETIGFYDSNWGQIGQVVIDTVHGYIAVENNFEGSTYTINDNIVTISYPSITNVKYLYVVGNLYTYKAVTSVSTLKDVVNGKTNQSDFTAYTATTDAALSGKQDTLIAGENITISGNVISATGGGSLNIPISAGTGTYSIQENTGTALGDYSHAEGSNTTAYGDYSHAEGSNTMALSAYSHTEGWQTRANGLAAHAEGYTTKANGENSHAEGNMTETNNLGEHASGSYNLSHKASNTFGDSGNTLFSVGNGTSTGTSRHNAFEIRQNGDIYFEYDGADTKLQDKLDEIESVTAAALNNLNSRVSEDEEVTAAALNNLNDRFGGLSLVKLTQQQYDNLQTKDSNTLYVIVN